MAITLCQKTNSFNNGNDVAIIINSTTNNIKKITIDKDFVLIISNEKIVGINVFNYSQYFNVNEGYHLISDSCKKFILEKFKQYIKPDDLKPFIKIGKVIEIKQHPNIEKLRVMQVEFNNEKLQIITNVQTIELNKNYLFALDGSILYSGVEIKETKVANVLSQGMLVSYKSIGIDKEGLVDCSNYQLSDEYVF